MIALFLALLIGCAGQHLAVVGEADDAGPALVFPAMPAGELIDGVYRDNKGFSVTVLEGWLAKPGFEFEQRRLQLEHVPTGSLLEVYVYPEAGVWPRERAGCFWTFSDTGPYGLPPTGSDVTVASCTPRAPDGGGSPIRVLGWYLLHDDLAWHIEAVLPRGYMAPGRAATEEVLATFRLP